MGKWGSDKMVRWPRLLASGNDDLLGSHDHIGSRLYISLL